MKKFRMKWIHKETGNEHRGPVIVGITRKEMERRKDYFNKTYKNATHEIEEIE